MSRVVACHWHDGCLFCHVPTHLLLWRGTPLVLYHPPPTTLHALLPCTPSPLLCMGDYSTTRSVPKNTRYTGWRLTECNGDSGEEADDEAIKEGPRILRDYHVADFVGRR